MSHSNQKNPPPLGVGSLQYRLTARNQLREEERNWERLTEAVAQVLQFA